MQKVRFKLNTFLLGVLAFLVVVSWGYVLQKRLFDAEDTIIRHLEYHKPRGAR